MRNATFKSKVEKWRVLSKRADELGREDEQLMVASGKGNGGRRKSFNDSTTTGE